MSILDLISTATVYVLSLFGVWCFNLLAATTALVALFTVSLVLANK